MADNFHLALKRFPSEVYQHNLLKNCGIYFYNENACSVIKSTEQYIFAYLSRIMTQHTWKKLHKVLFLFLAAFALAIFLPLTISITTGDVSPYVPYISEAGGNFPQAGIFTTLIVITCIFSETTIIFRYLVIEERCSDNTKHIFINKVALVIGTLSAISFVMVGAFPTTLVSHVHNVVAGMTCLSSALYMFCHTWISLHSKSRMKKLRVAITIFSVISVTAMAVFGGLGSTFWRSNKWPGRKIPQDEGFVFYVVSATAEWILALLYFCFLATFYQDFKESTFYFQLQTTQVSHTRPNISNVKGGQLSC
ncbi:hypothetical protein JTE90_016784 [Oedothorax gibbosus]|uniref:CWH43-like N-terminal domain-containing protein n=1 Tax=Oedothorax gibbosus TaxID=931172 RepID=A0AAV6VZM2_9ARAC|nr:hypothetical protein JTE90_016784 [Oedothorax gibbosus]